MIKSAGLRFREALRESNNNQKPIADSWGNQCLFSLTSHKIRG